VHDVAVVGGGIVGVATARELALRGRSVIVLEREAELGRHQTSHNSGVIHAGIYYAPGSLKARLCVEGASALYEYCAGRGIAAERCGKLVVAVGQDELARLDELERRARANGVQDLARLGPSEIAAVEPAAVGLSALHSPNTGMVDFAAVAAAYADDVRLHGGEIRVGTAVRALVEHEDHVEVLLDGAPRRDDSRRPAAPAESSGVAAPDESPGVTAAGESGRAAGESPEPVRARHAVACAGAWSDRLALASGARPDARIVPFRGAYLRLVPDRADLVRGQIYPVPDPALPFLGVHLSRTIDGEVLIGPTALLAPARDAYRLSTVRRADLGATLRWPGTTRLVRRWWRTGLTELGHAASRRLLVRAAARYVPAIGPGDVRPGPAGIRAQALGRDGALLDDFLLARTGRAVHVLNAPSPAATASLAIAEMIASEVAT
jgi:(S)-2-hydroxyglutarate dehydrogenase